MRVAKELARWVRLARSDGWNVRRTRKGHIRFQSPDGVIVITGSKISEPRMIHNARAQLRRAGLVFPGDIASVSFEDIDDAAPAIHRRDAPLTPEQREAVANQIMHEHPEKVLVANMRDFLPPEEGEEEIELDVLEDEPDEPEPEEKEKMDKSQIELIRFGKLAAETLEKLKQAEADGACIRLLEHAALLGLSVTDLLAILLDDG